MIFEGYNIEELADRNTEIAEVTGLLDEHHAKIWLYHYLRNNLSFTVQYLTGVELYPFQEIILKTYFSRDNVLDIRGRGLSKSYLAAVFAYLFCLFNPGVKVGILANNFRRAREIFKQVEDFANCPKGGLLRQCITNVSHKNDYNFMKVGKSEIYALPLGSGSKLRGFRFNCVLLDEAGFIGRQIIESVIRPFLSTNFDPIRRQHIIDTENRLILEGHMKAIDRTRFSNNKFIMMSSATFQFEYLYELFQTYQRNIAAKKGSYAVIKMSYLAAPQGLLNDENTQTAKDTMSDIEYRKEYGAEFVSDSGGFYSMKKMNDATVPDGIEPSVRIFGEKNKKYLLSIDPNGMNQSETSDDFAYNVYELDEKNQHVTSVHHFALSGGDVKDSVNYLVYLLKEFNIVFIIIDYAGCEFIDTCNTSSTFKDNKLFLDFLNADLDVEDQKEYASALQDARNKYNREASRIVYKQQFSNDWKRRANEYLQVCIERKKIWWGSKIMGDQIDMLLEYNPFNFNNLKFIAGKENAGGGTKKLDFIERQNELVDAVKHQISLIELKVSPLGTYTFELPQNLRRINSKTKPRRDLYSSCLMGNWAAKLYFDLMSAPEQESYTCLPSVI